MASTTQPDERGVAAHRGATPSSPTMADDERADWPTSPTSSPSPTGTTASTRLSAVSSSRGAALLDQHLALAASAYEQRDRGQRDHQPGQARGEHPHGGDAVARGARARRGSRRPSVGSPVERVTGLEPSVLDLLAELGARVLRARRAGRRRSRRAARGPRSAAGRRRAPRPRSPATARRCRPPGPGRSRCRRPATAAAASWAPGGSGQVGSSSVRSAPEPGRVLGRAVAVGHVDARHRRPWSAAGSPPGRRQLEADRVARRPRCSRVATLSGSHRPVAAGSVSRRRGPARRGRRSPRRPRRGCGRRWPG